MPPRKKAKSKPNKKKKPNSQQKIADVFKSASVSPNHWTQSFKKSSNQAALQEIPVPTATTTQQPSNLSSIDKPYVLVSERGWYEEGICKYHSQFLEQESFSSKALAAANAEEHIPNNYRYSSDDKYRSIVDFRHDPPENGVLLRRVDYEHEVFAVHIRSKIKKEIIDSEKEAHPSDVQVGLYSDDEQTSSDCSPPVSAKQEDAKMLYILSTEKGQWDPDSGIYHPKFEVVAVYEELHDAVKNSQKFISNKSWEHQPHNFQHIKDNRKCPPAIGPLIKTVDLDWNIEAVSITTKYLNDVKQVFTARSRNHPSLKTGYVLSTEYTHFNENSGEFEQECERVGIFQTKYEAVQNAAKYMPHDTWIKNPKKFYQIEDYRKNSPENGVLIRTVNQSGEIDAVHIFYQPGAQGFSRENYQNSTVQQPMVQFKTEQNPPYKGKKQIQGLQNKRSKNYKQKYLLISESGEYSAWQHKYYPEFEIIGIFKNLQEAAESSSEFMPNSMWLEEPEIFQDIIDNRKNPPENGILIKSTDQEGTVEAIHITQYNDPYDSDDEDYYEQKNSINNNTNNDENIKKIKKKFPQIKIPKRIPRYTVGYELLTESGLSTDNSNYEPKLESESIYQSKQNLIQDSKNYISKMTWQAPRSSFKEFVDNRKNAPDKGVLIKAVTLGGRVEAVHVEKQLIPDYFEFGSDDDGVGVKEEEDEEKEDWKSMTGLMALYSKGR